MGMCGPQGGAGQAARLFAVPHGDGAQSVRAQSRQGAGAAAAHPRARQVPAQRPDAPGGVHRTRAGALLSRTPQGGTPGANAPQISKARSIPLSRPSPVFSCFFFIVSFSL